MIKAIRRIALVVWIVSVISLAYYISHHREYLDPANLLSFFQSFGSLALIIYILASFVRGLVLLPSLPLVLVGILFFPSNPHLVFLISMLGIVFSGVLIYRFSDLMGFDEMFARHTHSKKIQDTIEKYGFYAVTLWSFVPVFPTDLICYVAGTVRMNFWKFILALTLGEGLIVGIIVYGGREMMAMFGL
ncbi:TVP38/TMEM64 family protein [Candidatus Gracilibacteria bacterium]|nr:TVP38/TMEM64 family protein [Candidatus Gracilibacteria bacterium]